MKKPYIIAEIGVNYYDIAKQNNISLMVAAKLMVKEAKESGANAVKFQSYKAGKIASKNSPSYWDLSKETTNNQFELFKKYDKFGELEYIEICDYCKEIGIDFMSTPFDLDSIDYLDKLVKTHKISSSDITNYPLLKKISKTGKKILLSTGASNLEEVKKAVQVIENEGNRDIVLLHCILNYPTF
jgi:sialic acid synthase SpsE